MTLYVFPPQGTSLVDIAPGADFATETTLLLIKGYVDGLETAVASTNTKLDTLHTDIGTTIAGYVDGLETLVTSTNTKLDTLAGYVDQIEGYVDGIETAIASTNTKLDTLAGYVDGLETLVGTTNTNTANLSRLQGSLVNVAYDYVISNYAGATSDVHTYKTGGSGGTTVKTVTINYTDSTKTVISTVAAT